MFNKNPKVATLIQVVYHFKHDAVTPYTRNTFTAKELEQTSLGSRLDLMVYVRVLYGMGQLVTPVFRSLVARFKLSSRPSLEIPQVDSISGFFSG